MLRKVLTYIGITFIVLIFGTYFYCAEKLKIKGDSQILCTSINVTILDSTINRFVSKSEVQELISNSTISPLGKVTKSINLNDLEETLNKRSAIKKSDVSVSRDGILDVAIIQRKPLLRIEAQSGGFYIDESFYLFPLVNTFTSYVPIVTGNIPLKLEKGYRGQVDSSDEPWLKNILKFGNYISQNKFWNAQIQQIEIANNGDLLLYTRVGDQTINFGAPDNIEKKFTKLETYYQKIVPVYGCNKYSEINLKYDNQIVCKLDKKKK